METRACTQVVLADVYIWARAVAYAHPCVVKICHARPSWILLGQEGEVKRRKKKLIKSLSASSASCIYTIYAERKWKAFKGSGVSDTMRYREGDITGRKFFVSLLETGVQTFPSEHYAWLYFLTFLPLSESRVCLCRRMLVFPQVRPQNDSMF